MTIHRSDRFREHSEMFTPDSRALLSGMPFEENFAAFYQELKGISLSGNVPVQIRIDFETIKNTLLYSVYSYRLSTVSYSYAYATFEKALKIKLKETSASLTISKESESFDKEILKCRGLKARINLALKYDLLRLDDFCPNFQIEDDEPKLQYLDDFIDSRNEFAHGTVFLDIVWRMPPRIKFISDLVNSLWITR